MTEDRLGLTPPDLPPAPEPPAPEPPAREFTALESPAEFAASMWSEQRRALYMQTADRPPKTDHATIAIVAALLVQPHIYSAANWLTEELDSARESIDDLDRLHAGLIEQESD